MEAIILAHHDSLYMRQLIGTNLNSHLPILKNSVLTHLLNNFINVGISDITVVCSQGESSNFKEHLQDLILNNSGVLNLQLLEMTPHSGVGECIYRMRDRIQSRYIFVAYADLYFTDLNLCRMFLHMVRTKASIVSVFGQCSKDLKNSESLPNDLLVIDKKSSKLIMYMPLHDPKKQVKFPRQILANYPHLTTCSGIYDVGIYLLSPNALKVLERTRDDPIAKRNFLKHFTNTEQHKFNLSLSNCSGSDIDIRENIEVNKPPSVFFILHNSDNICHRIDSLKSYLEVVRSALKSLEQIQLRAGRNAPEGGGSAVGKVRKTGSDYSLCPDSVCQDNVTLRSSFICGGCKILSGARVLNSILLSDAVVKSGCKIQSCVIGEGAVIEEDCNLKECMIAAHQRVPARTQMQSENLGFTELDLASI